jgi:hypothetical protein
MPSMMRARVALTFFCLCGAVWFCGSALHANPLKDPKRLISGQEVDLDPLFRWWTNHQGSRPLYAWAHVTGTIVATNSWGWTIEAHLDPAPAHGKGAKTASAGARLKIALKHPPTYELQSYAQLADECRALADQSLALSNEIQTASSRLRAIGSNPQRSRLLAAQARQLRQIEGQDKALLRNIRPVLADCRSRLAAFSDPSKYTVDCLALEMRDVMYGLPLYDYGVPVRPSGIPAKSVAGSR